MDSVLYSGLLMIKLPIIFNFAQLSKVTKKLGNSYPKVTYKIKKVIKSYMAIFNK